MAKLVLFLKNITVKDEKLIANQNDVNGSDKRFGQSNFEKVEFSINTNDILLNTPVQVTKDYDAVNSIINDYYSKQYVYGELCLIVFIILIWIASIVMCMKKFSKLRALQPQSSGYLPMNINEIRVVKNENDTVIYKKEKMIFSKSDSRLVLFVNQDNMPSQSNSTIKKRLSNVFSSSEPNCNQFISNNLTGRVKKVFSEHKISRMQTYEQNSRNMSVNDTRFHHQIAPRRLSHGEKKFSVYNNTLFAHIPNRTRCYSECNNLRFNIGLDNDDRNTPNDSFHDRNLLNPNRIPMIVRKSLLSLHHKSRQNLSKSESNLKAHQLVVLNNKNKTKSFLAFKKLTDLCDS